MKYTRPEVEVLGRARELVESHSPKGTAAIDSSQPNTDPAYDLDG